MTWLRSDDQDAYAAPIVRAGNAAVGALYRLRCWSAAQMSDGVVPRAVAGTMATAKELATLVREGLVVDHGDDLELVGFLDLNPSRTEVLEKRTELSAKRAEAGRKGAFAKWQKAGKAHGKTEQPNGKLPGALPDAADGPVPSRPDPVPSGEMESAAPLSLTSDTSEPAKKPRRKPTEAPDTTDESAFEAFCARWKLDARDPDVREMCDHFRGKDERRSDWAATARTWRSRAARFGSAKTKTPRNGHQATPPEGPVWTSGLEGDASPGKPTEGGDRAS